MSIDGGLRQLFRQHLPMFDWCSLESSSTGGGIPDSNFCHEGIEGFVEFKQTQGWAVTLAPVQVGWVARRVRHGGRVWVAVRQRADAGPRRAAVDALWLIPGRLAREAKELGLRGPAGACAAVQRGGPSKGWDWDAVAAVLLA